MPSRPEPFPLPYRVARKLVRSSLLGRVNDVLEVGCGDGQLLEFWQRRKRNAAGIDDRPDTSDLPSPADGITRGCVAGKFPFAPHSLDRIIVTGSTTYAADLTAPEALIGTANLLSALKPRRRAIFLEPAVTGAKPDETRLRVLEEHLASFPGAIMTRAYHDGIERFLSFEWLIGRNRGVDLMLVTITVPRKPISRLEWHQHAREAVMAQQASATGRAA